MPIFNFFKSIETEDLRYLIKLKDYEILPKRVDLTRLQKVWEQINIQYQEAEDNNSSVIYYVQMKSLHKMKLEYLMLYNIYNLLAVAPNSKEAKNALKYAGLQDKGFKWIEKRLKTLINKIKLKEADLKGKESEKKVDFFRILDEIEDIKGRTINPFTTTVRQYIAIKKNLKRKKSGKRQDRTK